MPVIKAAGQTFRDRLEISLEPISGESVHYTTDGSEPGSKSPTFCETVFDRRRYDCESVGDCCRRQRSRVVTAKYHRIPHDWKITLQSRYSSQYTGGGDFALIDGIRGTTNWSGGGWQGYQGKDFVAVIDLGDVQTVSKIGAGFLQDVGSWIWMPSRVEIELSIDGKTFGPAFSIANEVSERKGGVVTKDFVKTISPQRHVT